MPKRPSFQFYPADHFNDPGIRSSSLEARGLWWDMLCLMHQAEPYGHLIFAGAGDLPRQNSGAKKDTSGDESSMRARSDADESSMRARSDADRTIYETRLHKVIGAHPKTVLKLLDELEDNEVFSRTAEGIIYSRRMVHDEHLRTVRAEAGAKGAASTNARTLPARLPEDLPQQNGKHLPRQNGRQKSGTSSRARARSSSSPSVNNSTHPLTPLDIPASAPNGSEASAAVPGVTLPDIPTKGGALPPELEASRAARLRQIEEIARRDAESSEKGNGE